MWRTPELYFTKIVTKKIALGSHGWASSIAEGYWLAHSLVSQTIR
jgi:hypothetical protein